MKKNLIVLQNDNKECGSACLLSIIRYYGGNIPLSKLSEMNKTTKNGTNFYNIKNTCLNLGINAKGYRIENIEKLFKIKEPFLCQTINHNYSHFIIVYKIVKKKITIMDPAKGKVIMDIKAFSNIFKGNIMIFEPFKKVPIIKSNKYIDNIIIKTLVKNKKYIWQIFIISIIFSILTCIYSFYFQIMIDKIIQTNYFNLLLVSIIFLFIIIIKNTANYFRNLLLIYLNQRLDLSIILNTFKKILLLPYNYYKNRTTGEVISRINDLSIIKDMLTQLIVSVFLDLLIFFVGGIILFIINKTLFLILVFLVLLYLLLIYILRPIIKEKTETNQENNAKVNSFLVESISSYETIKGLNIEDKINDKMERIYIDSLNDVVSYNKLSNIEIFIKDLLEAIGILLILFLGCKFIMDGKMTLGSLLTFYSLIFYFLNPIRNIIDLNKEYYYSINSLKRANDLFDIKLDNLDKKSNIEIKGDIVIKNLEFNYNPRMKALKNISMTIREKEKVLLLGPSGCGKSTLLKILFKYYEVSRDKIFIDKYDINDYEISDIRKNISYISQNEMLYTDTIRNNIILNRNIDKKDFLKISKITYTHEIIKDLFMGYDTPLEENAINISGGQRQRIILARTLLKNDNLIMIDEGLNEIDVDLERKILKNIFNEFNKKTFIIVSHRTDNMDLYDKVIKFDKNGIIDIIVKNRGDCYL